MTDARRRRRLLCEQRRRDDGAAGSVNTDGFRRSAARSMLQERGGDISLALTASRATPSTWASTTHRRGGRGG